MMRVAALTLRAAPWVLTAAALSACQLSDRGKDLPATNARQAGAAIASVVPFRVPAETEVTSAEELRAIRRGRALLKDTRDSLPKHALNALQCVSCHTGDGTRRDQLSLIGVYSRFPQYRSRSGRVDRLEDRINDCFERSLNGRPLDRASADMRDMVAYMAFLSRGVPAGAHIEGQGSPALDPLPPDTARAAPLFAATCAPCHAADGSGTNAAPPLWGPRSYNIGAGMARLRMAAAFIRASMPQHQPGSLTAQQAYDLAAYINSRPRPDFARKSLDWPNGDPPPDVAYPVGSRRD